MVNKVDMAVHAAHDQGRLWPQPQTQGLSSQRRGIAGIYLLILDQDTGIGQGQNFDRCDGAEERFFALPADSGDGLGVALLQNYVAGAPIRIFAQQVSHNRLGRHWAVVGLHANVAIRQGD